MVEFNTRVVHISKDDQIDNGSKTTPIYQTSAFQSKSLEELESFYTGDKRYLYSRIDNPNTNELGRAVAEIEGAKAGVATSSGMSAILIAFLAVLKPGDHLVACWDLYGGTYQLITEELSDFGIQSTLVDFSNLNEVEKATQPNTKLLFSESITNPLLRVENIAGLAALAKAHQLVTIIDNTFASPYLRQPFLQGADLVVHSATKYIGGHSDVTAGVVVGRADLVEKAKTKGVHLGTTLSPFEAWLASRGLKTLSVRMERQVSNAASLAAYLKTRQEIKHVYYPELINGKGQSAIVTIELNDQFVDLSLFFKSLSWVKIIASLAGVETTVSHSTTTSHRALPKELCDKLGINQNVIRISVGIEDEKDIIQAFEEAILKASKKA
ncbi:aminotransferase class I/II-fold pyridoxal phosphate-dependent enzyme [Pullulanibacillus sp. KACC 23026]|uniref:trans-sulfuration enzyme family protein n=1 Tax=Pullulanibacillus sp. KACC 23026 TaxID=3028315 RepID=UPI0023B1A162|nr:aminotransferase class I/II-fold pyridoxal phosphate-dependent enzyme [Pullulanibacillus sp. KACC 23026]WEG12514.1 aminotransferase class I/II-fold pyridoxal phosphate-dependent enzyme [Pullulanibacillus sp. KACC 23026]